MLPSKRTHSTLEEKTLLCGNNSDLSLWKSTPLSSLLHIQAHIVAKLYFSFTYLLKTFFFQKMKLYHYINGKLVLLIISSNHKNTLTFVKPVCVTPQLTFSTVRNKWTLLEHWPGLFTCCKAPGALQSCWVEGP